MGRSRKLSKVSLPPANKSTKRAKANIKKIIAKV